MKTNCILLRLEQAIQSAGRSAVAVSGGVDSMTLAVAAHRQAPGEVEMFHAVSPAVPPIATDRVRTYALQEGWQLTVVDAGEFSDDRYRSNPVDRCFFCKTHLYGCMTSRTERTLLSGANTDDLGDYRPGLKAAAEHGVRHPYIEADICKRDVRALAHHLGLEDIAELPAAPCLSSRVETGIRIDPVQLLNINAVENLIRERLAPDTVRCRLRHSGIVIELDAKSLEALDVAQREDLSRSIAGRFEATNPDIAVEFAPYRMGSAFLTGA